MKTTKAVAWLPAALCGLATLMVMMCPIIAAAEPLPGVERSEGAVAEATYASFQIRGLLKERLPSVYLLETAETLHELLGRIERAGADPSVRGLILRIGSFEAGWAKVQEIRDALDRCVQGGKDVVCLLEGADSRSYYLATGAKRIVMMPAGHLMLVGIRAEALFARELLDKIGVKADLVQAGKYKGATEPLTRNEASEHFRESLESLVQDYYEQLLDGIVKGRGMPISRAAALIRQGPYTARQAKREGLVDDVMFYDELVTELEQRHKRKVLVRTDYGRKPRPHPFQPGGMSFLSLLMGGRAARPVPRRGPAIAVLYAVGPIMAGEGGIGFGEQTVSSDDFIKAVRKAVADDNVKSIVVRVDSPGGSALLCDVIWRELRLADRKKPVIASFSDTAASGGYYIGAAARRIYAEPATLTGSIGVLGGKLVLTELFHKIGLSVMAVERGGRTGLMSAFEEFSAADRKKIEGLVLDIYRTFVARVAEARPGMSEDDVEQVAQGRLWTGQQAHANGLVDEIGGLREAVQGAKEAAGIPADQTVRILHMPRARSIVEVILFGPEGEARASLPRLTAGMPPMVAEAHSYLTALVSLRREVCLCLTPAAVIIR